MTPYLIPTRTGREQEIAAEIRQRGGVVHVPEVAKFCRIKDEKRARVHRFTAWPGYIFAELTPDQFHAITKGPEIKGLYPSWMVICDQHWHGGTHKGRMRAGVMQAIDYAAEQVEMLELQERAGRIVSEFTADDFLEIIGTAFVGQVARFRRVIDEGMQVQVELPVLGTVTIPSTEVRKAC